MRCTATAKSTGERCKKWAVVGTTVCNMHGVTGATSRKAEERVTLAQLLERDPRHPWQVVLDMTHTLDAITQDYRVEVLAGETLTVDQLDRLIQLSRTTHHLATTAISTKAHEQVSLAFTRHLEIEGELVGTADRGRDRQARADGTVARLRPGGRPLDAARRRRSREGRRTATTGRPGGPGVRRQPTAVGRASPRGGTPGTVRTDDRRHRGHGRRRAPRARPRGTGRVRSAGYRWLASATGCAN